MLAKSACQWQQFNSINIILHHASSCSFIFHPQYSEHLNRSCWIHEDKQFSWNGKVGTRAGSKLAGVTALHRHSNCETLLHGLKRFRGNTATACHGMSQPQTWSLECLELANSLRNRLIRIWTCSWPCQSSQQTSSHKRDNQNSWHRRFLAHASVRFLARNRHIDILYHFMTYWHVHVKLLSNKLQGSETSRALLYSSMLWTSA